MHDMGLYLIETVSADEKKKEDLSQIVTGIRGIERFSVVTS